MKQRGRKSFHQSVADEEISEQLERLKPPGDMTAAQKKVFLNFVNSVPADHLGVQDLDSLKRLAYHIVQQEIEQKALKEAFGSKIPSDRAGVRKYKLLTATSKSHTRVINSLKKSLRLTPASFRKGAVRPGVVAPEYPWTRKNPNAPVTSKEIVEWIEKYCYIPEGKLVGKKIKLTKKQIRWLSRIFDSPTRVFILSLGRKNAKTVFAALLLLLFLCGPVVTQNSQLYSTAQSKEQAAILFRYAAKIVRMSPELSPFLGIRDNAKQLYCPLKGTLYKALSSDVPTSFGLSPVFTVHDELGQVRGPKSELYDALETASAANDNPLSVIISTQAPTDGDLFSMLIDDALTGADPRVKVEIYTADKEIDPFSIEAIRAANPHFEDFMNKQEVLRQAAEAKRMPSREAAFRNLVLNQRVEAKAPFIAPNVWMDNGAAPRPIGKQVVDGGLDLASVSDLCALVLLTENDDVHPTFWLPKEGLEEKSRADRVPYDKWAERKFLLTTPGRSVEYEYIAEHLRGVFDQFNVRAIAFDRYNMKFLMPWLKLAGFSDEELKKFVEFGQGYVSMSPAIRQLETKLLAKKYRHGNHPVLTMCANNATVVEDPAQNKKFTKKTGSGRIDGIVAMAMAEGVRPIGPVPEQEKKFQMYFV